jgi:threonine/homoserine/homoserine lactone efflux protein
VFILAALSSDLVYAFGAGSIRRVLLARAGARRVRRYVTAGVFFGLGATATLSK